MLRWMMIVLLIAWKENKKIKGIEIYFSTPFILFSSYSTNYIDPVAYRYWKKYNIC